MATINIGGLTFEYEPGQTYLYAPAQPYGEPEPSPEEKERSRADARHEAIKRFQKIASDQTLEAIEQTSQILFAQLIQFRALNGSLGGMRCRRSSAKLRTTSRICNGVAVSVHIGC